MSYRFLIPTAGLQCVLGGIDFFDISEDLGWKCESMKKQRHCTATNLHVRQSWMSILGLGLGYSPRGFKSVQESHLLRKYLNGDSCTDLVFCSMAYIWIVPLISGIALINNLSCVGVSVTSMTCVYQFNPHCSLTTPCLYTTTRHLRRGVAD